LTRLIQGVCFLLER